MLKDPQAVMDYSIDWTLWLTSGDTITTSVWTVPIDLVSENDSFSTTSTTIWLSGGVAGNHYLVINHVVTAQGREDDRSLYITCANR